MGSVSTTNRSVAEDPGGAATPRDADTSRRPRALERHRPSGWQLLTAGLTERGHCVRSVDLPADLPELLAEDRGEIVGRQCGVVYQLAVVAHSAAGPLLPSVSRRLDASHLVWLSSTIPDPTGQFSLAKIYVGHGPETLNAEWLKLKQPPTVDPIVSATSFHDCDLQTLRSSLSTRRLFYAQGVYGQDHWGICRIRRLSCRVPTGRCVPNGYVTPHRASRAYRTFSQPLTGLTVPMPLADQGRRYQSQFWNCPPLHVPV
jgi:hypothetical protein